MSPSFLGADPSYNPDEFLIEGVDEHDVLHTWTRNNLSGAKGLADNLVDNHGYKSSKVFNIFGGDKSDALHVRVQPQPIEQSTETQS